MDCLTALLGLSIEMIATSYVLLRPASAYIVGLATQTTHHGYLGLVVAGRKHLCESTTWQQKLVRHGTLCTLVKYMHALWLYYMHVQSLKYMHALWPKYMHVLWRKCMHVLWL